MAALLNGSNPGRIQPLGCPAPGLACLIVCYLSLGQSVVDSFEPMAPSYRTGKGMK